MFTLFVAVCAILSLTGYAFAANNITTKTSVPNRPKTSCEQAGSWTATFDSLSTMEEGDIIQLTLSSGAKICKNIDFFLLLADDSQEEISENTADPIVDNGNGESDLINVYYNNALITDANPIDNAGFTVADGSTWDLGFLVRANAGSSIVTLTLSRRDIGAASLTQGWVTNFPNTGPLFRFIFTPASNDNELIIKLFDEKSNCNYFFENEGTRTSGNKTYSDYWNSSDGKNCNGSGSNTNIESSDNTLCYDLMPVAAGAEYIGVTPDSLVDDSTYKLTFSGDYWNLHITGTDNFVVEAACKDTCPTFLIAEAVNQQGITSTPKGYFDPGKRGGVAITNSDWMSSGGDICATDIQLGNAIKMYRTGQNFDANSKYTVKLSLLRNGSTIGSDIAWWHSETSTQAETMITSGLGATYYRTNKDNPWNCDLSTGTPGVLVGDTYYYASAGPHITEIYAKNFVAGSTSTAHDAFLLDIPTLYYDYSKLADGDEIGVQVTFGKLPCGGSVTGTMCLGKAVMKCVSTDCYTLLYPYGLGSGNSGWWTGLVVTNLSPTETSTTTIRVYDTAGGSGSLVANITPHNQFTATIGQIMDDANWTSGATAITNTNDLFVEVQSNTRVDGLMFIGDTNVSVMHGYLPRVFTNCSGTTAGVVH
jgi:hypothetical protein